MKRLWGSLPIAGVLVVFLSSTAFGGVPAVNGSSCNPFTPADADRIVQDQFGTRNDSTTASAKVQCAVPHDTLDSVSAMYATVYDRHATENVCCSFTVQDAEGRNTWSGVGCTSGSSSAGTVLSVSVPNVIGTMRTECTIPPRTSTGWSHVTQLEALTN